MCLGVSLAITLVHTRFLKVFSIAWGVVYAILLKDGANHASGNNPIV